MAKQTEQDIRIKTRTEWSTKDGVSENQTENIALYFYEEGYQDGLLGYEVDVILKKSVKDRTDKEHLFLIKNKFDGSVRNYLLSMGDFKDDEE